MDKNAIKKFAVWARTELIARVSLKGVEYGIIEDNMVDANADSVGGKVLTADEKAQRKALIAEINDKGYKQVMEEVAYTWFNRFSALRFMEVNGYLPSHVRVFTDEENNFKPQIITEAIHLDFDGLDMEKVYALKEAEKTEELYKYLLIVQCNALNAILPGMFQKIADYTELLLPDNLLREGSVIEQMISTIPEEDWRDEVEIVGWLYQYYISEKHDEVVNVLGKSVIKQEDVPAATQLFTTDWVVRYMVDNSLGRYWIERHPEGSLAEKLDFLVKPKNGKFQIVNEATTPQDLTFFDPCMGSGHILAYAFDVLMEIYREYGYTDREAVAEIVQNNLHGFDIDERCTQLAYFVVMMKAREYDTRFFKRGIYPQVYCPKVDSDLEAYGSLLQVDTLDEKPEEPEVLTLFDMDYDVRLNDWNCRRLLSQKYAVVCTNPPYLNKYDDKFKKFVTENFKSYSGDLFSVFIYRNFGFCKNDGYSAFMTPNVWMFTKSYEPLRKSILEEHSIASLIQMAKGAFYKEATVDICSFVLANNKSASSGQYIRLEKFKGDMDVQQKYAYDAIHSVSCDYYYEVEQSVFAEIEGTPIAYWISNLTRGIFKNKTLKEVASPCIGMRTGDNNRFLRQWFEVPFESTGMGFRSASEAKESKKKWFPYNKGGAYRRWYGNNELVVNWEADGAEIKAETRRRYPMLGDNLSWKISNEPKFFSTSITWSDTTSAAFSGRYSDVGALFDVKGSSCFPGKNNIFYILGLLNTKITQEIISILNPTITTQVGDMARIPTIIDTSTKPIVDAMSYQNVQLAKTDWDSFETSWDFAKHLLIRPVSTVADAFAQWEAECDHRFAQLKANEEELNRIFIDIYGLQDELTPEVEDKDVTVRKADLGRDIRSFISYAVGCMFGRYSLDVDGLAYAGGEWDTGKYASFAADKDNIIPICDDEYFEDDIVGLFVKFVKTVYGADTLDENLKFIADALGGKGQPKDVIRNYFLSDFYSDHCKIYQKRPIYWLFDSGKKNGFKALIYMHRYQPDTIARIRTDYVHEQQARYRTAIADLEQRIANASTGERVKLNKKLTTLQAQDTEIRAYEERIHHLADQMISIDLDDGVKANYAIFQDVLAKIK